MSRRNDHPRCPFFGSGRRWMPMAMAASRFADMSHRGGGSPPSVACPRESTAGSRADESQLQIEDFERVLAEVQGH